MKPLWTKIKSLASNAAHPAMELAYKFLPQFVMDLVTRYFRVEVYGLENIPKSGPAVLAANHSGYAGLDALTLSHQIHQNTGRIPRVLTHKFWFLTKQTSIPFQKMGFIKATISNGIKELKKNNLVLIFPEGEHGNFKPSSQMYTLQEFKRGFLHMALQGKAPIIPIIVLGAEESQINLAQIKFSKYLRGTVIPLPLNLIPLPTKWEIHILPPLDLTFSEEQALDEELMHETADEIRDSMQNKLNQLLRNKKVF
jgi:1-acyl-sn-glycerol-3-phosphate acyltransferase